MYDGHGCGHVMQYLGCGHGVVLWQEQLQLELPSLEGRLLRTVDILKGKSD